MRHQLIAFLRLTELATPSHRLGAGFGLLLLGGALLGAAPAATASCLWEPPQHLFVLPADGAAEVPVDARIWVNVSLESHATVTVGDITLEGQRESLSWYSFPPPAAPAPEAACEFTVRICASEGGDDCTDYGPYSFTFGSGTAPAPAVPTLLGITGNPSEGNFEEPKLPAELCKYQILSQDCFDTGQNLVYRFVLQDDPGAALFAVLGTKADKVYDDYLSTPECGAQHMGFAPWTEGEGAQCTTETCRGIQAINLAGKRSEPVLLCGEAQITLDDGSTWHSDCVTQEDASGSAADKDATAPATPDGNGGGGSGCSAATHAPASGAFLLLAVLALAFALPRLRRRHSLAVALLALGLAACDGGNDPDVTKGADAVADRSGTTDAATETAAGDPEFAAYCQGIVDAFRALYLDLDLPDNLAQEKPPPLKTGEEFDPNDFFVVLDRLHMEEGWTLDFIYTYDSHMGGSPELVARKTDSPLCQSAPESPCESEYFLYHVLLDGSREGWFQVWVLRRMGQQFYCDFHGCFSEIVLPSHEGLLSWIEEQKKRGAGMHDGDGFDEAAIAAITVDPLVEVRKGSAHVILVSFDRSSGIVRTDVELSGEPPYWWIPGTDKTETLIECTWCGIP